VFLVWLDALVLSGSRFSGSSPPASNRLYRSNGDGRFTDVTKEVGLMNAKPRFGSGCAFLDYDCDGYLDLFVANHVGFDREGYDAASSG
jgi:hypothetical protein